MARTGGGGCPRAPRSSCGSSPQPPPRTPPCSRQGRPSTPPGCARALFGCPPASPQTPSPSPVYRYIESECQKTEGGPEEVGSASSGCRL
eukprot:642243-Pyramimonas_sp.AAC.1